VCHSPPNLDFLPVAIKLSPGKPPRVYQLVIPKLGASNTKAAGNQIMGV